MYYSTDGFNGIFRCIIVQMDSMEYLDVL
jgi:hypothetical protein